MLNEEQKITVLFLVGGPPPEYLVRELRSYSAYYDSVARYKGEVIHAMVELKLLDDSEIERYKLLQGRGYHEPRVEQFIKWARRQAYGRNPQRS